MEIQTDERVLLTAYRSLTPEMQAAVRALAAAGAARRPEADARTARAFASDFLTLIAEARQVLAQVQAAGLAAATADTWRVACDGIAAAVRHMMRTARPEGWHPADVQLLTDEGATGAMPVVCARLLAQCYASKATGALPPLLEELTAVERYFTAFVETVSAAVSASHDAGAPACAAPVAGAEAGPSPVSPRHRACQLGKALAAVAQDLRAFVEAAHAASPDAARAHALVVRALPRLEILVQRLDIASTGLLEELEVSLWERPLLAR